MKKVLVPTDFSSCASNAVNFAVQSAKLFPMEICIIHIFEESDDLYPLRKAELEHQLDLLKLSISEAEGVTVKTKAIRGLVNDIIISEALAEKVDMIIMGTFGAGGVMEKLWGSRTAITIKHSPLPVLLIPYDYEWTKPEKMLLATSNFEEEPALLDFVFGLAGSYKAKIELAVFTDEDFDDNITVFVKTTHITHYEQRLKERYPDAVIEAMQVSGKDFPEAMQQHLRDKNIDMLVMMTYQKNFVERIFHPSMTRKMSYITSVPLLAIPARGIAV